MRRSSKRVKVGDRQVRTIVSYFGDPCPSAGPENSVHQDAMIRMIADQPALRACGASNFQKLKLAYDGSCWVLEMEAVSEDLTQP